MAGTHEVVDVIKRIEPDFLKKLLTERLRLALDLDWANVTKRNKQSVIDAIQGLPEEQSEIAQSTLSDIAEVSARPENVQTIYDMLEKCGIAYDPTDLDELSVVQIACWACNRMNAAQWDGLKELVSFDNCPKGEWKSFMLEFEEEPVPGVAETKKRELESAVAKALEQKGLRGKHCEAEVLYSGSREFTVCRLNDRKRDMGVYDPETNCHETQEVIPLFEAIFCFDFKTDRLSVRCREFPKRAAQLCKAWADVVFGEGNYSNMAPVRYDISSYKFRNDATLPTFPDVAVNAAKIVGLDYVVGNKDSRRSYFEKKKNVYEAVRNECTNPDGLVLKRISIMITYNGRRAGQHKVFTVSETAASGLSNTDKVHELIRAYVDKLGIEVR